MPTVADSLGPDSKVPDWFLELLDASTVNANPFVDPSPAQDDQ